MLNEPSDGSAEGGAESFRRARPRRPFLSRLIPRTLATRTALILLAGLGVVQGIGLGIHARDEMLARRVLAERYFGIHVMNAYGSVLDAPLPRRRAEAKHLLQSMHLLRSSFDPEAALPEEHGGRLSSLFDTVERPAGTEPRRAPPSPAPTSSSAPVSASSAAPSPSVPWPSPMTLPAPPPAPSRSTSTARLGWSDQAGNRHRFIRLNLNLVPMPRARRPLAIRIAGERGGPISLSLALPDRSGWLNLEVPPPSYSVFDDPTFPIAWGVMSLLAAILVVWATRRLVAPVATLAIAADKLGRDVNAPPLPEDGPEELARASAAFNTMAARIRRFVGDRTFLLTAIGHDLRTPITRLKLRAEFIEDEDTRHRFLHDLDELEAMVAATLAFGRDSTAGSGEPAVRLDLAALLRTVLDDAADARPHLAGQVAFRAEGPRSVPIQARPLALKRSFANLVNNALAYAGTVSVTLQAPHDREVRVLVEDDGPGIPPSEVERVFEPFRRLETSRSRETGGTGLGLSIARNIVRGHGGEITLQNRADGGLRALVVLPR